MGAQEPRRLPSAVLPGCLHKADGRQMCANKQRLHNCIPGWNKIPKAHSHFLGKAGCSYRAAVLEEVGLMAGRSPRQPCPGSQLCLITRGCTGMWGLGRVAWCCCTQRDQDWALSRRREGEEAPELRGLQGKPAMLCELETGWGKTDGGNVPLRIPSTLAEGKCTFRLPSYAVLPWRLQVLWWPQGTWMGHFGNEQRKDQRGL